jgi:hypothetical protein
MRAILLAAASVVALASSARSAEYPILDVAAVPNLSAQGRLTYERFLLMSLPRTFALAPSGVSAWLSGGTSAAGNRDKALGNCEQAAKAPCAVYAQDLQVVARPVALPAVPAPWISTGSYAFVPDNRYFWHGPAAAAGVYVWGHGNNGPQDVRGWQPQPHVRAFNNAGFDILRFDRDPSNDYPDNAKAWLRDGLVKLRADGYRKIIAGGQSRGAWAALQALAIPGLVDGAIAISPASQNVNAQYMQRAELQRLLGDAASPAARVVVAEFAGDGFVSDPDQRTADIKEGLAPRVAALMLIDRPAGFEGHGGGATAKFAVEYGPCIYRFVLGLSGACAAPAVQVSVR